MLLIIAETAEKNGMDTDVRMENRVSLRIEVETSDISSILKYRPREL